MNLEALVERFRGPLVGLLVSWGARWSDAHDLAQDVFVEAFFSKERFSGDWEDTERVGAWLRGIARNLFWNHLRALTKAKGVETLLEDLAEPSRPLPSPEPSPVMAAMQLLSENHREALWVVYLEGNKVKEAAALLEVSAKTVEGRLYQARKELKRILTESNR